MVRAWPEQLLHRSTEPGSLDPACPTQKRGVREAEGDLLGFLLSYRKGKEGASTTIPVIPHCFLHSPHLLLSSPFPGHTWTLPSFGIYHKKSQGVPLSRHESDLASMRTQVQSLALLSGLRIGVAVSRAVRHRGGSDLTLLWPWPAATAPS